MLLKFATFPVFLLSFNFSVLIFCLLSSVTANVDNVLTFSTQPDDKTGYIVVKDKPDPGNITSFCTWMKFEGPALTFFEIRNAENDKLYIRVYFYQFLGFFGLVQPKSATKYQTAFDCNFKNVSSWFHFCAIYDLYDFYFYLNGLQFESYYYSDDVRTPKPDKVTLRIGEIAGSGATGSFYRTTVFSRNIKDREILELYRCKPVTGKILLDWTEITSKSANVQFNDKIELVKDDVPCPDRPVYVPVNCSTNEVIEYPPEPEEPEPSSGGQDPGPSPGTSNPSSGFGNSQPGSSSGNSQPGSSSGTSNPSSSAGNPYPSSSAGNPDPSSSAGNPYPSSGTGNSNPSSSAGGMNSGSSSQNMNSESSPASTGS